MQIQPKVSGIAFGPVTERALIQRINRKLAKEDERLCRSRPVNDGRGGTLFDHNLGEYYRVDVYRNVIIDTHVDLVALARELGVMHPSEKLAE